jgi:Domain of unknown function (DUF1942)
LDITNMTTVMMAAAFGLAPVCLTVDGAPVASADSATVHDLGDQAPLVDGSVVQGWTLGDLRKSSDIIPYPVQGTLWEANATDQALEGSAIPVVSNLNARTESGQSYRALFQVATPQGVNPGTLAEGQKTSGKVYFDATGDAPDSLVYNAAGNDLLVWVQPQAPAPSAGTPVRGAGGSGTTSAAMGATDAAPAAPAKSDTPVSRELPDTPLAPGVVATPAQAPPSAPVPAGSHGTPATPNWQGTPVTPAQAPAPVPTGSQGTAATSNWQGTPVAAAQAPAPVPTGSQGTAATPNWQGTPLPAEEEPQTTTAVPIPAP